MLSKLEVRNRQGALLALPLEDPEQGFIVQDITGLEPVLATLVSSSFANMDGAQFHSSRREARNIRLTLGLDPDHNIGSVRELRQALYEFFMPKSEATLRFHIIEGAGVLDFLDLEIKGRVESFEAPLFAQEPTVTISLMCFDPDFRDVVPVRINEFTVSGLTELVHEYRGTVETGIDFSLKVNRSVSGFTIYHRPPDGTLRTMEFTYALLSGDVLKIGTNRGAKEVTLVRKGVESSLLYALSPQSAWIELQPGLNNYRVYVEGTQMPFTIDYTPRYGGL